MPNRRKGSALATQTRTLRWQAESTLGYEIAALRLMQLLASSAAGVVTLAESSIDNVPAAMTVARSCFEPGLTTAWLLGEPEAPEPARSEQELRRRWLGLHDAARRWLTLVANDALVFRKPRGDGLHRTRPQFSTRAPPFLRTAETSVGCGAVPTGGAVAPLPRLPPRLTVRARHAHGVGGVHCGAGPRWHLRTAGRGLDAPTQHGDLGVSSLRLRICPSTRPHDR